MDQDLCISCGLCVNLCPAVFGWNDEQKAEAKAEPVPAEAEACCQEAAGDCPTQAIARA